MSFWSDLFGGGKSSTPDAPAFKADPLVNTAENSIFNFGSDILKGILPASYQNLLQFDSPQFESVLHNSNRDITSAGLNTAALQGNARSGAANAGISKAVADNSANMRYADYMNTVANQKALLGTGLDAENVAGNMALGNQGQINNFNASIYGTQSSYDLGMNQLQQKSQQQQGSMFGSAFSEGIGSIPYLSSLFGGGGGASGISGILGAFGGGAAASAGTGGIDALLASGAPLLLA